MFKKTLAIIYPWCGFNGGEAPFDPEKLELAFFEPWTYEGWDAPPMYLEFEEPWSS
ncbi:hypothetical protein ES703_13921 [subsurface metagenome]